MKKTINSFFVIIAAMITFAGCVKEEIGAPAGETKTVEFLAEQIGTKTAFGTPDGTTYPTLWTSKDSNVKIALNFENPANAAVTPSADFKTATFAASVTDNNPASYVFHALSPASAFNSFNASSKYLSANIPNAQTPLANSVDEAAQVLYAVSDSYSEMPSKVSLNFKHFTAYGKFSIKNLSLNGATITSVAISSNAHIAGRWNYNVDSKTFSVNSGAGTITLKTSKTEDLWFACAPVDMGGKTLTITVNTDKGPAEKTITLAAGKKFEAGKIATFTVDMTGVSIAEPEVYELVKNPADLTVGSKVIIAASSYNFAISTTQNSNNRAQAAITKSSDKSTISDPGSDVEIMTIQAGTTSGTVAFKAKNGYLYAASSSSNYLKTEANLSANSSWKVTITTAGVATVKAQGTNTRNWLRYNNSSKLFACYASGQADIVIYKLKGSGAAEENYLSLSPESTEVAATTTTATFSISSDMAWTITSPASEVAVQPASGTGDSQITVTFPANETTSKKEYTVTVTAGDKTASFKISQKGKESLTEASVAQFLTAAESDTDWYQLTGTISNLTNTTYGNFDLTDATGKVAVYGLTKTKVASNDKSFSGLNLKEGDIVTLIGLRDSFNGTAQVGGPAYYVSHESSWAAPVITCTDNTVTITAETGASIYYTTDGTVPTEASTKYGAAFTISTNCTVKAIAIGTGKPQSAVNSLACTYRDPASTEPELVTETISGTFTMTSGVLSLTTSSGIKISQSKGSSSTAVNNSYNTATTLRVYKGHTLTFSGKTITKIEISHSASYGGNSVKASTGTYTAGSSSSVWTGESDNIVITNTATANNVQLRPTKIVVTYQK